MSESNADVRILTLDTDGHHEDDRDDKQDNVLHLASRVVPEVGLADVEQVAHAVDVLRFHGGI